MKNIVVLLTCFNRKAVTLKCLERLKEQKIGTSFDIFLCDDGSTDGTYKEVKELYPDVFIFKGTGNLFWNRGMLASWKEAIKHKKYDAYIWLNDDAFLFNDAIQELLDCSAIKNNKSIICGQFRDSDGNFSYGGRTKDDSPLIPNGEMQEVFWLNGNGVLVPQYVVNRIGILDGMFHHHMGDYDYGLRALEAGIKIYTTRKYIGQCEKNHLKYNRGRKQGVNILQRFKYLYSPIGDNPIIKFRYTLRHFGLINALKVFVSLHINNLLSDKLYNRIHKR